MPCMNLAKTSTKSMVPSYEKPWCPVRTSFGCMTRTTLPRCWTTKRLGSILRDEVIPLWRSTEEIVPMCIARPDCWRRENSILGNLKFKNRSVCDFFLETESNGGRYARSYRRDWVRRRVWETFCRWRIRSRESSSLAWSPPIRTAFPISCPRYRGLIWNVGYCWNR